MGNYLDAYRKSLEQEKLNEELPKNVEEFDGFNAKSMTEEEKKLYRQKLDELRNSENSMEAQYRKRMAEIDKYDERQLTVIDCVKEEKVTDVKVLHAYCPECHTELVSETPTCFNPMTMESMSIHTCKNCGKKFNLEHAYPRLAYIGEDGKEIKAFGW